MSDTNELPEALRLAGVFDGFTKSSHSMPDGTPVHVAAATELRRLHAECKALRSAAPTAPAAGPQQGEAARLLALACAEYNDAAASVQHGAERVDVPEWAQLVVRAYTHPAPAVERGVTEERFEAWFDDPKSADNTQHYEIPASAHGEVKRLVRDIAQRAWIAALSTAGKEQA